MQEALAFFIGSESLLVGTIIPFLFVLTVVVFVHEMGHYLVGRWCGIGASAFSIGFGPELIGFTDKHGTRWKLSAIPLGGYVKFLGDESATSSPVGVDNSNLSAEEQSRAFHTQPVWKRAATVFAGPAFNIILTVVIFSVFFALYGRQIADPLVAGVQPGSPAAEAGFEPGDRFVSVEGQKITTFSDVQRIVSGRSGDELDFTVERGGKMVDLKATPALVERTDPLGNKVKMGAIGVETTQAVGNFRRIEYGPLESVGQAIVETGHIISRTGEFFQRFAVGREDKCQLGGPVKIANMAGKAASQGFDWLIQLTAMLSIGIGLLNLFPLPPLDGGHLVFYAVEAIKGSPVSVGAQEIFYRVGFLVVMGFMGFVLFNDLFAC
ncbi:RIP metalloprotease RseP [Brucella pseudogrignonensis]|uniref:Zinc metalloprotease n=1 Tax=Brucella pseudogrignonensis TaxID=419475 RepID=A0A256GW41_9HYPH|nr:RIP metalloprotease RseP [Brucella pseudogrignonensis]EMG54410.1 putative membrane-associated zinc metalloprotease [Ochrobactrum sp. CDB2]QWK76644.1 RIP metalloprotease RseP [Ochrobactrum sp. BTU1]KAB2691691.1 RIP metalloprotease RseP [Brucella pseudogrignonensis]NNV22190.1 RIP metalloprotease RseP [Brucella pseudogrignonensis]OYR30771.1 RIP metalloprotease RseP [Brucella pseudogrignonensis]